MRLKSYWFIVSVKLISAPFIFALLSCTTTPDSIIKEMEHEKVIEKVIVSSAAEIQVAMVSAKPGDTLFMQNKVWENEKIYFKGNGVEGSPIVLKAETPGKVILSGSSTLRISGTFLVADGLVFQNGGAGETVIEFRDGKEYANHCRLTNTVIKDYNPVEKAIENKWVSLYGTHNRVDHCLLEGKTNQGATLVVWLDGQPNYHRIDHNYFGPRPDLGQNGGETIRIGTSEWSMSDSYTTVDSNYFENCDGEIEIISNKSGHNTFRNNTFDKCAGTLTLRHGNYATVERNLFLGRNAKGTGGVRIIGSHHLVNENYFLDLEGTDLRAAISVMNAQKEPALNGYWLVDSAVITNNVMISCKQGIVMGSGAGERDRVLAPVNCVLSDNKEFLNLKDAGNPDLGLVGVVRTDVGPRW